MTQLRLSRQPIDVAIDRPTVLTVICIMGFVGTALSIPMLLAQVAKPAGAWFSPYASLITVANLVCMLGLWRTRRWGLHGYAALVFVNQLVLIAKGEWNLYVLMMQGAIVLISLYHLHPKTQPAFHQVTLHLKRKAWAVIVAYMLGIHNPYRDPEDDAETVVHTIEEPEEQTDSAPKD